jgi:hypothetical protein
MANTLEVTMAINEFCAKCGNEMDFPDGGEIEVPQPLEADLLATIRRNKPFNSSEIAELRIRGDVQKAYSMVIFAVRTAIWAYREESFQILSDGAIGLILDEDLVDYRDMLGALAIIDECATRMGTTLTSLMAEVEAFAMPKRLVTIKEEYLSRTEKMKSVAVMGFKAVEMEGRRLRFLSR